MSEHKTLEYKLALSGGSDSERKEFLANVSSFANAAGGCLIYGMKADSGVPVDLPEMEVDGDAVISGLESKDEAKRKQQISLADFVLAQNDRKFT